MTGRGWPHHAAPPSGGRAWPTRGLGLLALALGGAARAEVLPSWNDGAARQAIVAFVGGVTQEGGPVFPADSP